MQEIVDTSIPTAKEALQDDSELALALEAEFRDIPKPVYLDSDGDSSSPDSSSEIDQISVPKNATVSKLTPAPKPVAVAAHPWVRPDRWQICDKPKSNTAVMVMDEGSSTPQHRGTIYRLGTSLRCVCHMHNTTAFPCTMFIDAKTRHQDATTCCIASHYIVRLFRPYLWSSCSCCLSGRVSKFICSHSTMVVYAMVVCVLLHMPRLLFVAFPKQV